MLTLILAAVAAVAGAADTIDERPDLAAVFQEQRTRASSCSTKSRPDI